MPTDRSHIICTGCEFLVHLDPCFGHFCCKRCHQSWEKYKVAEHGEKCQRRKVSQGLDFTKGSGIPPSNPLVPAKRKPEKEGQKAPNATSLLGEAPGAFNAVPPPPPPALGDDERRVVRKTSLKLSAPESQRLQDRPTSPVADTRVPRTPEPLPPKVTAEMSNMEQDSAREGAFGSQQLPENPESSEVTPEASSQGRLAAVFSPFKKFLKAAVSGSVSKVGEESPKKLPRPREKAVQASLRAKPPPKTTGTPAPPAPRPKPPPLPPSTSLISALLALPAPEGPPPPPPVSQRLPLRQPPPAVKKELKVGTRVRLQNFKEMRSVNGQEGEITERCHDGRYHVLIVSPALDGILLEWVGSDKLSCPP